MKKFKILMICLWSLVAVALTAILVLGICGDGLNWSFNILGGTVYKYKNADDYSVGGGSVSFEDIKHIDISWVKGDVNICAYEGEEIVFDEDFAPDDDGRLRYLVQGSTLFIKYCKSGFWGNVQGAKELTVKIPTNALLTSSSFDVVDTSLSINSMLCSRLEIDGVDCDLTLDNAEIGELDTDCVDIAVEVSNSSVEKMELDGVDCNINAVLDNCPQEIDFDAVGGKVTLLLPDDSGYTVIMDVLGKNLSGDFDEITNDKAVYGNGKAKFEFDGVGVKVNITVRDDTN